MAELEVAAAAAWAACRNEARWACASCSVAGTDELLCGAVKLMRRRASVMLAACAASPEVGALERGLSMPVTPPDSPSS